MSRNAGIVLSQSERTEGGREREEGEEETNAKRERDGKPSAAEVRADRKGEERERERERERTAESHQTWQRRKCRMHADIKHTYMQDATSSIHRQPSLLGVL